MPSRSQHARTPDRAYAVFDLAVGLSSDDSAEVHVDDDEPLKLELPDPESVYRNYLVTCERLGVTSVPRERADKLIAEWAAAIAAERVLSRIKH